MSFSLTIPGTPSRRLEAIICDNDGLLVDSEPLAIAAWRAALAVYGIALADGDLAEMFGQRLGETTAWLIARYQLPISPEALANHKTAIMNDLIRRELQPMAGARALVAWLEAHAVPHALATSGLREHAALCLAAVGMSAAFTLRVTGEDVAHAKPAPDLFLAAAHQLGVAPRACLVLEDAPNGVLAALAAEMAVIAVPNAVTAALPFPTPTGTASSLHAVLHWLAA